MKKLRSRVILPVGLLALAAAVATQRSRAARQNGAAPHDSEDAPQSETPEPYKGSLAGSLLVNGFGMVNRYKPWHKLPLPLSLLNLIALRIQLREHNLYDTASPDAIPDSEVPAESPRNLYTRTFDGSYNDLGEPAMGSTGMRFGRNVPVEYTFPESEPALLEPSPRLISSKLLARDTFKPATTLNMLAAAWIQFMTHDWFNHGIPKAGNEFGVQTDPADPWFEETMKIPRTPGDTTRGPREAGRPPAFRNVVSHWWDASAIYGCDEAACARLRSWEDGKLRVENGRLPLDPVTGVAITGFNDNWWIGLGLMHTLFTLEHNSICDRIKADYPNWSDEQIYQTARLINAALMAKIHTIEWTPAIIAHPALKIAMNANWWGLATERIHRIVGRIGSGEIISGIPGSPTEHHGVPFTLTEEFAAVYRMHPLIPDELLIHSLETGELLKQLPFPEVVNRKAALVIDDRVSVQDVFYSFGTSHPGAITLHNYPNFLRDLTTQDGFRVDLGAVDILRDRERGIPRYNQFRRLIHLHAPKTFEEMTDNREWAKEMKAVYGDVERVDLMAGMYAETPPAGFGFSDTAFRIFILMASRRLKSDRFFTTDFTPRVYTQAGIDWIADNDMSSVLLRHYPELAAPLRHVANAFAPWPKVSGKD